MIFECSLERGTIKMLPTIRKWWVTSVSYGILAISWTIVTTRLAKAITRPVIAIIVCHLSELPLGLDTSGSTPIRRYNTPLAPSPCPFLDYLQGLSKTFVLFYHGGR